MIGKTLPISEMKPTKVHMKVTIAIEIINIKYFFVKGVLNRAAKAYIRPTTVLYITKIMMTDMIRPIEGEIFLANNKEGSATSLIWSNSVTKPKLIINSKNVMIKPPIKPPYVAD